MYVVPRWSRCMACATNQHQMLHWRRVIPYGMDVVARANDDPDDDKGARHNSFQVGRVPPTHTGCWPSPFPGLRFRSKAALFSKNQKTVGNIPSWNYMYVHTFMSRDTYMYSRRFPLIVHCENKHRNNKQQWSVKCISSIFFKRRDLRK